jgi:peptidoglycan/LPS O-acetylase OafA/YrhL
MKALRITLSALAGIAAALFLYAALTVPAFAATAPAVLGIACVVLAYFLWPKKRNRPTPVA